MQSFLVRIVHIPRGCTLQPAYMLGAGVVNIYRRIPPPFGQPCRLRCGDSQLKGVMGDWWHDVLHRCHRDQLALQYNLWRNDQTWLPLDEFVPRQRMLYHARHGHPNAAQRAHDVLRRSLGRRIAG